ncbi:MAG: hypothetical protein NT070_22370 [Cyanobacteria bacterium]|nr:hypothetical protein [Cyanobacteriota bacterium]
MISSFTIAPQDEMKMKSSKYLSSVGQLFTSTQTRLMEQAIDLLNGDAVTQSIHELEPLLLPITT